MNVSMPVGSTELAIGHVYFRGAHHHLMDAFTYGNRFEDSLILVGLHFYAMLL
jgi:hypothetical protein